MEELIQEEIEDDVHSSGVHEATMSLRKVMTTEIAVQVGGPPAPLSV
jgi:hypothetical protein